MLDRNWNVFMMKNVLKENPKNGNIWPIISSAAVKAYKNNILSGWESKIFRLSNPILITDNVKSIVSIEREGKKCRIYPPFPLNDNREISGTFEEITIPEGIRKVTSHSTLPSSVVKGLNVIQKPESEPFSYCRGIRFDTENGFPEFPALKGLIDQIAQYTHQWWLRSPQSPFRGPLCFGSDNINKKFEITNELRYHGAGEVESAWYATIQTQKLLGPELPLTNLLWLSCLSNLQDKVPAERGLLYFYDAIAYYMAEEDDKCILNLALCFEILANKRQFLETGKIEPKIMILLKKTPLVEEKVVEVIKKLIVDRDHVAHGRAPHVVGRKQDIQIEAYFDAIRQVINKYFALLQPGEWPKLAALRLDSTRKRYRTNIKKKD